jgi:hypothetical protein
MALKLEKLTLEPSANTAVPFTSAIAKSRALGQTRIGNLYQFIGQVAV